MPVGRPPAARSAAPLAAEGRLGPEPARAKVNLTLHVTGREGGFHMLETLMCFADGAEDQLWVRPAEEDAATVTGPMAGRLHAAGGPSLLTDAALFVREARPDLPPLHWTLEKTLPVAAGIGGGSADAGAALRLMGRMGVPDEVLSAVAPKLGSDVPVCYRDRAAWGLGRGDRLRPMAVSPLPAVLVNPGIGCPTPRVFAAFKARGDAFSAPVTPPPAPPLEWIGAQRSDLTSAAMEVTGEIRGVLRLLADRPGAQLARLSGSGATCFGVYESDEAAEIAALSIRTARPGWWVQRVTLS